MYSADEPHTTTIERVITLAFGGDRNRYEEFLSRLRTEMPAEASAILRGSAVTGSRWSDGQQFDADGPGSSDLDLTFVGGGMLRRWDEFYIPGLHTVPLSDEHPDACPELVPLRNALCHIAGRPVNLQATTSLVQFMRDVTLNQPYVTLIEGRDDLARGATHAEGAA